MKILQTLGPIVSMVLPACAGWTIVTALWPGSPKVLRGTLGFGLGLGVAGAAWMVAVMLGASAATSLAASEIFLLVLSGMLWIRNARTRSAVVPPVMGSSAKPHAAETVAFIVSLLLAATAMGFTAYLSRHGDFDAAAIWNSRARFFYLGNDPLGMLADLSAPDYPLLLPSLVTRGWQYSLRDTTIIPISIAMFFTAATFVVVVFGLRLRGSTSVALLAGCLLAGTPFFLSYGVSQSADMVMCFFVTSAVMLWSITDFGESEWSRLPVLSGLFAGLAACTKNEGSLFVIAMIVAQFCVLLRDRRWRAGLARIGMFLEGLALPVLALVVFRARAPVSSILFAHLTAATIQARLVDTARHSAILAGYWRDIVHFGEWWINPLAILLAYAVARRVIKAPAALPGAWRFPAIVVTVMLCGYYVVYLLGPYEVNWHVAFSLPRLLLQLWPPALLLWGLLVSPARSPAVSEYRP